MNAKALIPLAALGALASLATVPHAQNASQKIGYVDVQAVLQASPKYGEVDGLYKKSQTDLKPAADQLKAIQDKGTNATAAERQQYDTLLKTYQANAKKWEDQVNAKLTPINADVNTAVTKVAQDQGFSMVLNKGVAAGSQLVIYADEKSLDLTPAVIAQIKK